MGSLRGRVVLFAILLIISTGLLVIVSSKKQKSDDRQFAEKEKAIHATSAFVHQKIASAPIIIFSKTYCPYCMGVKKLFKELGQNYEAIELDGLGTIK